MGEYINFDSFRWILGFNVMLKSLTQRKVFQDTGCLSSLITILTKIIFKFVLKVPFQL